MKKEDKLVKKWLKGDLTPEELAEFKRLDSYSSYAKILEKAAHFKAPAFDEDASRTTLANNIRQRKSASTYIWRYIAAAVILVIIAFTFTQILQTDSALNSFETGTAQTEQIQLPDASSVFLNAKSNLSYAPSAWEDGRSVVLYGEALFKVEKGSTFSVSTAYGNIEVLGTVFNVKSRDYGFSVSCYEGSVEVQMQDKSWVLKANEELIFDKKQPKLKQTRSPQPDWKENRTHLDSQPLYVVLEEFKNYYEVEFDTTAIDLEQTYTGSFVHDHFEIALKSITLPLDLSYTLSDKKIIYLVSENK